MGNKYVNYSLEGMIEFDEENFTVKSTEIDQEKGIRGNWCCWKI